MIKQFHKEPLLYVHSFSTGFIEVPSQISLNVFVFGCMKRCPECHNPELQEFSTLRWVTPECFKEVIGRFPLSSWVCFLGGDAVYQSAGLEALSKTAKECGKNVCLYTGLTYEELDFLKKDDIDLIIDGEYIKNLGPLHEKTTNQRIFMRLADGTFSSVNYSDLSSILTTKTKF